MRLSTRRLTITGVMAALSLLFLIASPVNAADLKLQVIGPATVTPEVPFSLTIKAYNFTRNAITFNRVLVAYTSPDLSIHGPFLVSTEARTIPITSDPTKPSVFKVTMTILPPQQSKSLVPILVTLWKDYYTTGYQRGVGAGAVKLP